jgi:hypothetical protein
VAITPTALPVKLRPVFVDRERRFSLDVDENSDRRFVSFPVHNRMATYEESYEVDKPTFERWVADPKSAYDFIAKAKARELDHLLLFAPGTDRGFPD